MSTTIRDAWLFDIERRPSLLQKRTLIFLFTVCYDTPQLSDYGIVLDNAMSKAVSTSINLPAESDLDKLQPLLEKASTEYVVFKDTTHIYGLTTDKQLIVLNTIDKAPFELQTRCTINDGDIENYHGTGLVTSYGRYLVNYRVLVTPFHDKISYIDKLWDIKSLEKQIATLLIDKKITTADAGKYIDCSYLLGAFGELINPVFSPKSLTTDKKIIERRNELLRENKDKLTDPVVCAKIEDELIGMDKEYLKKDPAYGFYSDAGKKFNNHRKRQFLTTGIFESFEKENGKYAYVPGALSEGWNMDSFVTIANEIRSGSYKRGVETMLAGVQAKFLLRLFQESKITGQDCKSKHGLYIPNLTEALAATFDGYNIITPNGLRVLDKTTAPEYVGTAITVRSFMYCKQPNGYCFTCAGKLAKNINSTSVGTIPLELSADFLALSMAAMHGIKLSSYTLTDLDQFVV